MCQDACRRDHLLEAPTESVLVLQEWLQVLCVEFKRHKSQNFIQFREIGDAGIHCLQALSDPLGVAAGKNKLLLENVDQVLTVVAADSHDSEVELGRDRQTVLRLH